MGDRKPLCPRKACLPLHWLRGASASGPDGQVFSQHQNWLPIHSRWPVRSLSIHRCLREKAHSPHRILQIRCCITQAGLLPFQVLVRPLPAFQRAKVWVPRSLTSAYGAVQTLTSTRLSQVLVRGNDGLHWDTHSWTKTTKHRSSFIIMAFLSTWRESIILLKKTRTFHGLDSTTDLRQGESCLLGLTRSRLGNSPRTAFGKGRSAGKCPSALTPAWHHRGRGSPRSKEEAAVLRGEESAGVGAVRGCGWSRGACGRRGCAPESGPGSPTVRARGEALGGDSTPQGSTKRSPESQTPFLCFSLLPQRPAVLRLECKGVGFFQRA